MESGKKCTLPYVSCVKLQNTIMSSFAYVYGTEFIDNNVAHGPHRHDMCHQSLQLTWHTGTLGHQGSAGRQWVSRQSWWSTDP